MLKDVGRAELGAIFVGGCLGALLRYGLIGALPAAPGHWPWATLLENLAGAFVIGMVAAWLPLSDLRAGLLGPGLCGALTTFSTLQLELLRMLDRDELALAMAYAGVSITAGLVAVLLGTAVVRRGGRVAA